MFKDVFAEARKANEEWKAFGLEKIRVKLEIARTAPVFMELYTPATNGLISDFKSEARAMNEEQRTLGLERIREEVRRQVQDYLDTMK